MSNEYLEKPVTAIFKEGRLVVSESSSSSHLIILEVVYDQSFLKISVQSVSRWEQSSKVSMGN